ncbi:FKBP-type peptidyl-prolyl cis-trans isomerase [Archaeoglobus sp.]
MPIEKGDIIRISYTAKLEDGTVIDTTDEKIAKEFGIYSEDYRYGDVYVIVGERNVVEGFEEDLIGKDVGYKGTVKVPPEKAFGKYDPEKKEVISIARLKEKPRVGDRVKVGDRVGVVERIIGRRAIVDFNHPLAGKSIIFEYEIKEKVDDIAKKVEAIFMIYTGMEVKAKVEGKKAIVEVPRNFHFIPYAPLNKVSALARIFKYLDVEVVEIVERHKKAEVPSFEEVKKEEEKTEESREEKAEVKEEKVEEGEETEGELKAEIIPEEIKG